MSNKVILKAYERYDYDGKVVPGSLVLRSKKPKNGRWKQVDEFLCCNPPAVGNILTFRVRIFEGQTIPYGFEMGVFVNSGSPSSSWKIHWGDGIVEEFSTSYSNIHTYPGAGYYLVTMEFTELNYIESLRLGVGGNKKSNHSGRVTWISGLDIFNAAGITNIFLPANELTTIALPELSFGNNSFGILDLSSNYVKSLVINNTVSIQAVDLFNTPIENVVINAPDITGYLYWFNTKLSSFDFYKYPSINGIDIQNSKFTSLDCHNLTSLYNIYCVNNLISSIDVSGCTGLNQIFAIDNPITTIDVTGCTSLLQLYLSGAALSEAQVNNLLITLDDLGVTSGYCNLDGGTNAVPTGAGLAAKTSLEDKGWSILTN